MKIPEVWEDCKTKKQKDAFLKGLEDIDKRYWINKVKKGFVKIKHKNISEPSLLICDKIDYANNHLMFFKTHKKEEIMVFKVWLKRNYKSVYTALKSVGVVL